MNSGARAFLLGLILWPCIGAGSDVPPPAALGTSVAVDGSGRLWIAYAQAAAVQEEAVTAAAEGGPPPSRAGTSEPVAHVLLQQSEDAGVSWQAPVRVTAQPEPVSADGENRPKLAFGPQGEMYVTWTSPTSARYTGDIRLARSLDGGKSWSTPAIVHRDRQLIAHRFESLMVDGTGRVWVAWIDKRDLEQAEAARQVRAASSAQAAAVPAYAGAAIYYAYSDDQGSNWRGDFKLADHSCECCRIALTQDAGGRAVAMWRHIFAPNERDHAYAVLDEDGDSIVQRTTFERWRVDACPHHGPSLAFTADGVRHAVWFNLVQDEGRAFYGRFAAAPASQDASAHVQVLPAGATHADIAAFGNTLAVAWKRFDGEVTRLESWISRDGGEHFSPGPTLHTDADSDQPRLISHDGGILLVWRRAADIAVERLVQAPAPDRSLVQQAGDSSGSLAGTARDAAASTLAADEGPARQPTLRPFERDTLAKIRQEHAGEPFWLVLWDLECSYCMKSLANLAQAQRTRPQLKAVTITTDPMQAAMAINERLRQLGVRSQAYAFTGAAPEALRYAIDPAWLGEKPRAYRYSADGQREAVVGVISAQRFGAE